MPWLRDHFTLRLTRMEGTYSLRLVCESCGSQYTIRSGKLHNLYLGREDLQKIVTIEERHYCSGLVKREVNEPERLPY